ncbi:hypothetical protein L7F22_002816 [Adiantum nelumboides]|nr:hypothetical protein [Adiantum nelumboides]
MWQARKWRCAAWYGLLQKRGMSRNIPGMRKRTREKEFEKLVDADKPYKKVMALKNLLIKVPENVLSFAELGKSRSDVGLSSKSRFITLISKYPAIFSVHKDEANALWCGFAPQAQILADQECALVRSYEAVAVQKLRKLLMMAIEHRIRVPKIAQLRRDLGFPADFHSRMIYAYPQYFKAVEEKHKNEDGPVLELTCWDPSLAVTNMETRAKATHQFNSSGDPLFKMCVTKAFRLSMKEKEGIRKFQERIFISPYADSKDFHKNTAEFEKRQVAVLHEILSMTLEKKTTFDYLTHFRKEFRLSQTLLAVALRHNSIFYVSRKGGRFTIFLKEAYEGGCLIEKNEWNIIKENFSTLMVNKKLKEEDLAKTADKKMLEAENAVSEELVAEEEDPEFDALISLCRRISKGATSESECRNVSRSGAEVDSRSEVMPSDEVDNRKFTSSSPKDLMIDSTSDIDDASSGEEWDHGISSSGSDVDDDSLSNFHVHSAHVSVSV